MQVTKRTFLKGLLATAAAGGVVSQASAKPQADLPAKWDREADVVILGYGGAGASAAGKRMEIGIKSRSVRHTKIPVRRMFFCCGM